ncbi:glycosyltransferase family 32 protein [Acinetobacter sp. ANC 4193]
MNIDIPKILGHIWIGPHPAPEAWMNTWKEKHSDWEYRLYDNNFLKSFNFRTQKLIDFYLDLELYAGVADLMRYEILYETGGFIPEADSICYHNIEEILTKKCAYTVYENELIRGKLVAPIYACEPKNKFVGQLIEELLLLNIDDLDLPWKSTGNLFVAKMIEKYDPNITIFPSHFFNPVHFEGITYEGSEKVYAKQLFGSTQSSYQSKNISLLKKISYKIEQKKLKKKRKMFFTKCSSRNRINFCKDFL